MEGREGGVREKSSSRLGRRKERASENKERASENEERARINKVFFSQERRGGRVFSHILADFKDNRRKDARILSIVNFI